MPDPKKPRPRKMRQDLFDAEVALSSAVVRGVAHDELIEKRNTLLEWASVIVKRDTPDETERE